MKKRKINITVIKEESGYSATAILGKTFIGTEGESFIELQQKIYAAINLATSHHAIPISQDDLKYTLDLKSFFDFYDVINAKAFSARIGMNQSLLAQYISGNKKPSVSQTKRILEGIRQIGNELANIQVIS